MPSEWHSFGGFLAAARRVRCLPSIVVVFSLSLLFSASFHAMFDILCSPVIIRGSMFSNYPLALTMHLSRDSSQMRILLAPEPHPTFLALLSCYPGNWHNLASKGEQG